MRVMLRIKMATNLFRPNARGELLVQRSVEDLESGEDSRDLTGSERKNKTKQKNQMKSLYSKKFKI